LGLIFSRNKLRETRERFFVKSEHSPNLKFLAFIPRVAQKTPLHAAPSQRNHRGNRYRRAFLSN
jgi:hypothetical protein